MHSMMQACEQMKHRKYADWEREKEEDVAIQQAYIKIQEKQEQDWTEEYKRRE
jgi:hypothetical protein